MIYKKMSHRLSITVLRSMIFLVTLFPTVLSAQTDLDTVELKKSQSINRNFPLAYPVDIQYTYYTPTKMTTKLLGKDYLSADIKNQQTLTASANALLFMKKGFLIVNSFQYQHGSMDFQNIDSALYNPLSSYISRAEKSNVYSNAVNFIYMGKLFGRKLTCDLITTIDFSEHGYERTIGKLVASINIKENKRTSISVGLIGSTDPTATIPVTPQISITSWIGSKWLLDAYMPAYVYIRRIYDNNSRLSFGMNMLNGAQAYVHPDIPTVSSFTFQRGRVEFASTYQKVLFGGFTLSTKVGYVINMEGKVLETDKSNPIVKLQQKPNLSFNIGLSYNFIPKKYRQKSN